MYIGPEVLAALLIIWFMSVMFIAFLYGSLTYSSRSYELGIYKFHRYIVIYIFALPILIIAMALLKSMWRLL